MVTLCRNRTKRKYDILLKYVMKLFILQHVAAIIYALMRFAGQIAGSFLLVRVQRRHLFIVSALCVSLGKSLRSHPYSPLGKGDGFFPQVSSSWAPPLI